MAYLNTDWISYTDVGLSIKGLQYPSGDYDGFMFINQTTGESKFTTITFEAFYGLSENTTYTFEGKANYQGTWYSVGTVTITTLYHPPPTVPSSAPYYISRGEGSLTIGWGESQNATSYNVKYRNYLETKNKYSASTQTTITNLLYGVTYYISVAGYNYDKGYSAYTEESTLTTAPKTPTISQGVVTNTSVQINISGMEGNYDYVRVYCYNSSWQVVGYLDGYSGGSVTFTGLSQGQTYYFQAWSYFTVNGTTLQSVSYSQVTVTLNSRPANWAWSYTIASGQPVYNTIISNNQIIAYIMPATEWNSFTSRINDFRRYRGLPDYGLFISIGSGSDCTPDTILQAIYAINAMDFSIPGVSAGNISASTFTQMRDALNSIT